MKNVKEKKTEELYVQLSAVDDTLLREAEEADSREKLYPKTATVLAAPQTKRRGKILRIAAILAACLAVAITATLVAPLLMRSGNDDNPVNPTPQGTIYIDSLHALNYYGGQVLRTQNRNSAKTTMKASTGKSGFRLLSADELPESKRMDDIPEPKSEAESKIDPKENPAGDLYPDDPFIQYDAEKDYYYFAFDPDTPFTVSKVMGFQITLTEESGFLAERLGTGLIDVVITMNSFEDMITFRSRDGRYFSCLGCESGEGEIAFINHKFIDRFRVVKDWNWTLFRFTIRLEEDLPVDFTCDYYYTELSGDETPLDAATFTEGSGYAEKGELTVTAAELATLANDLLGGTAVGSDATLALLPADRKEQFI